MSRFVPQSVSRSRNVPFLGLAVLLIGAGIWVLARSSSALTNNGSITAFEAPLTENFDTLTAGGAWTDNTTLAGWYAQFGTSSTNPTAYTVSTGNSGTGALYSFGSMSVPGDRALGSVGSGTTGDIYWAAKFTNNTGITITSLTVSYTGEEWRAGGCTPTPCTPAAQTVDFQYQVANAGTITDANTPTANWIDHDPLDFTSPQPGPSTAATLDGNAAANRTALSSTITVTVNAGQQIWLRWKDINHANNDHGLAIDDLSVTAHGAGPTNPTGIGNASPSSVDQGGATLLTVAVTPGTNPPSTAHTVTANLSSIGGASSQSFFDDGTHGDVTGGDNTFSFSTTVSSGTSPGAKTLPVTIQEVSPSPLTRTGSASISLTVNTPTSPTGVGAASPSTVQAGNSSLLTVSVTPGTHPPSTGLAVTADLSSIGGSSTQQFFDNGTNGDVTAGDNVFSFNATVSSGTSAGAKNLPATITDAQSRSGSANIALNVTSPTTSPTGTGAANPSSVAAGSATLLTVNVTPGANPTSTNLAVAGNLSSIGGSATQQFFDDGTNGDVTTGDNIFSYNAPIPVTTTAGAKTLPFTISDAQSRSGSGNISLTVTPQVVSPGTVVVSQIYGGGGNSGATYTNDFIEIFNRSNITVNLSGWSVQYTSASATGSWSRTNLSGTLAPGQYYLVQESAGSGGTTPLPTPDATGTIGMSASNGHVALVSTNTTLSTKCPTGNPQLMDLVGYGTAACFEGAAAAPGLDNVTADLRTHAGCKDTDSNGGNFVAGSPTPRNSASPTNICPTGDFPPEIFSTSPASNQSHVPQDANITINFDEPVNVAANWYQISCASTGLHTA